MAFDEKNYPMTYKEYEKRVIELLLEDIDERFRDLMMEKVEAELKNEPNYIHGFYGQDCFTYDSPDIYGDTCKKAFEDNFLKQTAVANLRKLL